LVSKLHPDANLFEPPPRTPARDGPAPRASPCPSPAKPSSSGTAFAGSRSAGTAAARGRCELPAARVIGTSRAGGWCPYAGCSSGTSRAPTATSTSSPPT
jgi:hypothetical protein